MNILRQQYHGGLPLISLENYLNNIEDTSRKNEAVSEKLEAVEDLNTLLLAKNEVIDKMLKFNKLECSIQDDKCAHNLQKMINVMLHMYILYIILM